MSPAGSIATVAMRVAAGVADFASEELDGSSFAGGPTDNSGPFARAPSGH